MKKENIYYILTIFIVFLIFKKIIDLVIDLEFTTYEELEHASGFWKFLVGIRDILAFFTIFFCSFLLISIRKESNFFINGILVIILIYNICYFLFDNGLIYNIVAKTPENKKIITLFDVYLNSITNVGIALFSFYSLVYIFFY